MSRCIYADVLKEDIAKQLEACKLIFSDSISEILEDSMDGVYKTIDRQPTVDVVEVVRGEWEVIDYAEPRRYGCSICRIFVWHQTNYCPNCGADMRERREE